MKPWVDKLYKEPLIRLPGGWIQWARLGLIFQIFGLSGTFYKGFPYILMFGSSILTVHQRNSHLTLHLPFRYRLIVKYKNGKAWHGNTKKSLIYLLRRLDEDALDRPYPEADMTNFDKGMLDFLEGGDISHGKLEEQVDDKTLGL